MSNNAIRLNVLSPPLTNPLLSEVPSKQSNWWMYFLSSSLASEKDAYASMV